MAKLWLGKVRALFHFILSLRIDMKKRVYRNFDTPSSLVIRLGLEPRTPTLKVLCSSN